MALIGKGRDLWAPCPPIPSACSVRGRGGIPEKHLVREEGLGRVRKVQMGQEPLRQREAQEVEDVGRLGKRPGADPKAQVQSQSVEICGDPRPSSHRPIVLSTQNSGLSPPSSPSTDTSAKNPCYPGSRQVWFCSQAWPLPPLSGAQNDCVFALSRPGAMPIHPFPENPCLPKGARPPVPGPPLTATH